MSLLNKIKNNSKQLKIATMYQDRISALGGIDKETVISINDSLGLGLESSFYTDEPTAVGCSDVSVKLTEIIKRSSDNITDIYFSIRANYDSQLAKLINNLNSNRAKFKKTYLSNNGESVASFIKKIKDDNTLTVESNYDRNLMLHITSIELDWWGAYELSNSRNLSMYGNYFQKLRNSAVGDKATQNITNIVSLLTGKININGLDAHKTNELNLGDILNLLQYDPQAITKLEHYGGILDESRIMELGSISNEIIHLNDILESDNKDNVVYETWAMLRSLI